MNTAERCKGNAVVGERVARTDILLGWVEPVAVYLRVLPFDIFEELPVLVSHQQHVLMLRLRDGIVIDLFAVIHVVCVLLS